MYDLTDNYNASFYIGGAMLILAGSVHCLLHLPWFKTENFLMTEQPIIPTPEEMLGPDDEPFELDLEEAKVEATVSVV